MKFSSKFKAFTLVELLVSITIIGIISVLSISAYPKFSEQMAVTSEVYKILAFAMETKSYGVGSYTDPGVKVVYAFLVEQNNNLIKRVLLKAPTSDTNQYYLDNFVDDTNTTSSTFAIKNNYTISDICFFGLDKTICDQKLDKTYAIFKRPNPDARLIGLTGTVLGPDVNIGSYDKVEVTLQSRRYKNLTKKIVILATGQMYVK